MVLVQKWDQDLDVFEKYFITIELRSTTSTDDNSTYEEQCRTYLQYLHANAPCRAVIDDDEAGLIA
jgi:hypothetical protein